MHHRDLECKVLQVPRKITAVFTYLSESERAASVTMEAFPGQRLKLNS